MCVIHETLLVQRILGATAFAKPLADSKNRVVKYLLCVNPLTHTAPYCARYI